MIRKLIVRYLEHPLTQVTLELLLKAYAFGMFPMAKSRTERDLDWVQPKERGIIPLDRFHVPRSLRKVLRQGIFKVRTDSAFGEVIEGCA